MVDTDLYWLAGILEGEGTFVKPSPSNPNVPKIQLSMTDEWVVSKVADLWEVKYFRSDRNIDKGWKPTYITKISGYPSVVWMKKLYPLMSPRRQSRIDEIISIYKEPSIRRFVAETRKEILDRVSNGETKTSLAKEFGIDRRTIGRWCKNASIA